jgi:ACS family allantoate permease-like MFS transporter
MVDLTKHLVTYRVWKKEQFIEALCDWKLWAFALMAALNNVPNR